MFRAALFLSAIFTVVNCSYAADALFSKDALELFQEHFDVDVSSLNEILESDAENYLTKLIEIYRCVDVHTALPNIAPFYNELLCRGGLTVTINNFRYDATSKKGYLIVAGVPQKLEIHSIDELKTAVDNWHWFSLRKYLTEFALAASAILVEIDKTALEHRACDGQTPESLRVKLRDLLPAQ